MREAPLRVDGWKAIAAHFRRDRSTVVRWASTGDLPVRRVPGKKGGSVWAYVHELDAWLAKGEPVAAADAGKPGASDEANASRPRAATIAAGLILVIAGLAAAILVTRTTPHPGARSSTLPDDPAVTKLYLQARDDWATRTPSGLDRAMSEFGEVISRDPGFAPAYAGVADTYLLEREFSGLPDAVAYPKAEAAARLALAIDADSPEANRAIGFIDFWKRRDIRAARDRFQRALRIAPNDAQTHFWFGSVLVNFGDREAGLRELADARRLNPGSPAIAEAYGLALWMRGPGDSGRAELEALSANGPPMATVHIYLSWIYLVDGHIAAYLDQMQRVATLQQSPALVARVAAERAAYHRGGDAAVLALLATAPPASDDVYALQEEWPATAAAMSGRRDRLLALMAQAAAANERWTTWRRDQIRFAKWRDDPSVMDALRRLHAFPEPASGDATDVGATKGQPDRPG